MTELPRGWSIGTELELSDVERDLPLPGASRWDRDDYTIVNSNGVANDPTGEAWRFGGEVNTEPTDSIAAQVDVIADVLRACRPAPAVNYRSNFHVHVRVPGLRDDLPTLKRAIAWAARHSQAAFDVVDPLPARPADREALVRWRRRRQSHHTILESWQLTAIAAAESPSAVYDAHARRDRRGRPLRHLVQRPGVSFLSLWGCPAQTVEFRHFCMSLDVRELRDAMRWCVVFLSAALDGAAVDVRSLMWASATFPQQPLYDAWLEPRYRASSRRYHSLEHVRAVIEQWRREGTLDGESARVVHRQSVAEPVARPLF